MNETAPPAAVTLARFAAGLRFEDLPAGVVEQAKVCITDTAAVSLFGSQQPWSRKVAAYAKAYGGAGACTLMGSGGQRVTAPMAALAHGAFAHAFEQDSLRRPGAGVHPGAAILPAAWAVGEETGASGRQLLTAFVAAVEVMFRIGAASRHSSEQLGFHAPGLTGPYGAAVAAGLLWGLDAAGLTRALGIAGSLGSGLLAFTKSPDGAMIKRLHLGRAAESGVLAARLAVEGFEGPSTVLDGRFGFLEAYCREADASRLTAGLGQDWEVLRTCIKAYPCHVTAHTPVQALRCLMAEHGFEGVHVARLDLQGAPKLLSHHAGREPADLMQAQYSVPFCVALAAFHDPADPRSWTEAALADERVRGLCRRIGLTGFASGEAPASAWHTRLAVALHDGRTFTAEGLRFKGMPEDPLDAAAVAGKFRTLLGAGDPVRSERLLEQLQSLETARDLAWFAEAGWLPGSV